MAAPETLVFMPNGDVTLILTRFVTTEVEAPSKEEDSAPVETAIDGDGQKEAADGVEAEAPAEPEEPEESILYYAPDPPESIDGPFYPPPPRARRGSDASSRRDRSASPPASFWASLKRQKARIAEPIEDEEPLTPPPPVKKPERIVVSSHEVHCVVSSRHMMLASQQFQTLLSGDCNEAITLRNRGQVTISLSADLDTMIILLNIIHGASRKVPRQVDLETLSKLAVLVSRFGMLETVEFFSDTWIDNLQRRGLPNSYNENVLPLLFIFWVFDRPADFKDMTRLAQRESNEKLYEDVADVPIPHSIIDAIKRDREFAMEAAVTVIHALIEKYMVGDTICDGSFDDELRYACDAMVLGSLMKSSRKIGVWPKPDAPFNDRNFKDLARTIRSIRVLDVSNKSSTRRWNSHGPSSNCHGLEDMIETSLKSIEAALDGLELSDYAKTSEDFDLGFQDLLLAPSKDELKEGPKEDNRLGLQVYNKHDEVELPREETKIPQKAHSVPEFGIPKSNDHREVELPVKEQPQTSATARARSRESLETEVRLSAGASSREADKPAKEDRDLASRQYQRELQKPEARSSPSSLRVVYRNVEEPVKEDVKLASIQYSREAQKPEAKISPLTPGLNSLKVEEPARQEVKQLSTEYSREPQKPEAKVYPLPIRLNSRQVEEPARQEGKQPSTEYSRGLQQLEARSSPLPPKVHSREVEKPTKQEVKQSSTELSRSLQRTEARASPRASVQEMKEPIREEVKSNPRESPIQEARIVKKVDLAPKEEVKPVSKEEARILAERKVNHTPPLQKVLSGEVKSPVKEVEVAPTVSSIEEIIAKSSSPAKEEVKSPTIQARDTISNAGSTTTDTEETWAPPTNFKLRKSKKTFSTRY